MKYRPSRYAENRAKRLSSFLFDAAWATDCIMSNVVQTADRLKNDAVSDLAEVAPRLLRLATALSNVSDEIRDIQANPFIRQTLEDEMLRMDRLRRPGLSNSLER